MMPKDWVLWKIEEGFQDQVQTQARAQLSIRLNVGLKAIGTNANAPWDRGSQKKTAFTISNYIRR